MDEEYVCTLDEASLKKAKEELQEDPKERLGQVDSLRKWILQQPHLKCPTDTKLLLCFLRTSKFSQLRARDMVDRFYTAKTTYPEWLGNIDMADPKQQTCLKTGAFVALPGRLNGRRVFLSRMGQLDMSGKHYVFNDVVKTALGLLLHMFQDEANMVNGFMIIRDFTNVTLKNFLSFIRGGELKKLIQMWQGTIPGRMKGIYYYNAGVVIDTLMGLTMPFLSKKMQSRIHVFGSNMEEVYKVFPMELLPEEYLPDDYTDPNAGPINGLVEKMLEDVTSSEARNRVLHITSNEYGVDESMRPKDVPQESFRKLQLD